MRIVDVKADQGKAYLELIKNREDAVQEEVNVVVKGILDDVKVNGDDAVVRYTNKFDSPAVTKDNLKVTRSEIKAAYGKVEEEFLVALKEAAENITFFH
ncbi:MAG TPA: histidinol dehydrogenase, partial [Clostridiaceae bacterium]